MKSHETRDILNSNWWCRISSINSIIYLISICSLNIFNGMNGNLLWPQDGKAIPYCHKLAKTHPTSNQISAHINCCKVHIDSSMRVAVVAWAQRWTMPCIYASQAASPHPKSSKDLGSIRTSTKHKQTCRFPRTSEPNSFHLIHLI